MESIEDKYRKKGLCGIRNVGNTCYMNSVLQVLSNIPYLTKYFLENEYLEERNVKSEHYSLMKAYRKVLEKLWENNSVVNAEIRHFKSVLDRTLTSFKGHDQHDANEFMVQFLDSLHEALKCEYEIDFEGEPENERDRLQLGANKVFWKHYEKQHSKITELFSGQNYSKITTMETGEITEKFDPFYQVCLPINDETRTLRDCFKEYSKQIELTEDNKYYCSKKEGLVDATREDKFIKAPNVLIIVLKRFNMMGQKNGKYIRFPLDDLSIKKYFVGYEKNQAKYKCIGVVNHMGSLSFGHYTAYARNIDNKWYEYNDADVSTTSGEREIVSSKAYILVYLRKDLDEIKYDETDDEPNAGAGGDDDDDDDVGFNMDDYSFDYEEDNYLTLG